MENPNPAAAILAALSKLLHPGRFLWIVVAVLIVIGISSGIYTVPTDAEAIVMRFGKYSHTTKPGLQFKIPFGIDQKEVVPVRRIHKLEFGFSTQGRTNEYQASSYDEQRKERSMITGDRNAATVEWVVQYRIDNPTDYLFRVRHPEDTLRDSSESVMREVVGDRTVDEVITVGRQSIEDECLVKLQSLVNHYGLGFKIDQVQLKNVNPPAPVQPSFNEVNEAQQDRDRLVNIARGQYNKAVPKAKGEADQKIAQAEGNSSKRINEAQGDAGRFLALYAEYEKFPAITRQRLYLERMQEVLPKLKRKIVIDQDATGVLPLLHLDEKDSPVTPRR